jgi:hypothetical protein
LTWLQSHEYAGYISLDKWFPNHPEMVLQFQFECLQQNGKTDEYELYTHPLTATTRHNLATMLATMPPTTFTDKTTSDWAKTAAKRFRDSWISADPSAWLAWADAHPAVAQAARGEAVNDAQVIFKSTHADARPAAADAWLGLADDTKRSQVLRDIISDWSAHDINEAGTWLQKAPNTPERWDAVATFAKRAITEDPEAALTWTATITDAPKRYQAERDAYLAWHRQAPADAQQWLNERSGWNPAQTQEAAEWLAVQR